MANIVILGPAYPLRGGGMSTFNERLAREFMHQGHQVVIYTFSLQYPGILFPGKTQYSNEPPPADLHIKVKINSINPLNWCRIGVELKNKCPDYLIIRYWMPFMAPCLGTIAAICRRNKYTKIIAITDNITPHEYNPGSKLLTSYFLSYMDHCVAMSQNVINDLKSYKIDSEKITLCQHPLYDNYGEAVSKVNAAKLLNLNSEDKYILFFGFIREYKGLDLLIKAMANESLRKMNLKLLVAGEFYTDAEPFFSMVDSLNLSDKVIWHNHFIESNLVKYYFSLADLVAQPYKSATQSGVTQVAYHFEIPMLVTNVGGLPEMVPNGKVGYVVNPDPESIGAAITDYFVHDRKPGFLTGIKEEKKRFSWKNMTDVLLQ